MAKKARLRDIEKKKGNVPEIKIAKFMRDDIYDNHHHIFQIESKNRAKMLIKMKTQILKFELGSNAINIQPNQRSYADRSQDGMVLTYKGNELLNVIRYRLFEGEYNRRIELQDIKATTNDKKNRILILMSLNRISQRLRTSHVVFVNQKSRMDNLKNIGFLNDERDDKSMQYQLGIYVEDDQVLQYYRSSNCSDDEYGPQLQFLGFPVCDRGRMQQEEKQKVMDEWGLQGVTDKLAAKLAEKTYSETKEAKDTDQYQTPIRLTRWFKQIFLIESVHYYDPCQFAIDWDVIHFMNALPVYWPLNKIIVINHPFSMSSPFLLKCCQQYLRGCNIIMIIPCLSLETTNYDTLIYKCIQRRIEGSICFGKWLTANQNSHSILEFLQPQWYDRMETIHQTRALKYTNDEFKKSLYGITKRGAPNKTKDFVQIEHLMNLGWGQKLLNKEFGLHPRDYQNFLQVETNEGIDIKALKKQKNHRAKLDKRNLKNQQKKITQANQD